LAAVIIGYIGIGTIAGSCCDGQFCMGNEPQQTQQNNLKQ